MLIINAVEKIGENPLGDCIHPTPLPLYARGLIAIPPPLNPAILTPPPTVTPSPMPAAPKRKT